MNEAGSLQMPHGSVVAATATGMGHFIGQRAHASEGPACMSGLEEVQEKEIQEDLGATEQLARTTLASEQNTKSAFRGVYWDKVNSKWLAKVSSNKITVKLGLFSDESDAAAAFDKAALLLRGRETELNFPLSNYLDAAGAIVEDERIKERLEKRG